MHLIRSHRLTYIQVRQVIMQLIFSYRGRDFASPVLPCSPSVPEVWEESLPVKTETKKLLRTLASFSSTVTSLPVSVIRREMLSLTFMEI